MGAGVVNNFLGFLVIGILFYFVIRKARKGGCCGHSHNENGEHNGHLLGASGTGVTKDPVCGMTIEKDRAEGFYEYNKRIYRFCSVSCREQFQKEPGKYIKGGEQKVKEHHCC